ncbi:MAG: hypothetical protein Ta2C_10660 [Candidatus Endomicrobiellum trichonymphae]|uniref:hypothetical protein n=1 Tax=Endomicrobium trichonymphae TaxID=1408204 RepID=UPI0027D39548|nr:MAG: hypothetical protein Ta2C_10660 [Candidatus Endomicrobium trichonymphae]
MQIIILKSAYKHGITYESIISCLARKHIEYMLNEDPLKKIYVGFDNNANPLEIIAIIEDNIIKVIHAMKIRKQYECLLEELNA